MKPGKFFFSIATVLLFCLTFNSYSLSAQGWKLIGNAGTSPATNFIGTTDNQPMVFRTFNTEVMRITSNEKIGIGTNLPTSHLHINGYSGEDIFTAQSNGNTKLFVNSLGVSIGSSVAGPNNGLYVNGFVGVGTASPAYQFDVVGVGRFSGRVGINGGVNSSYALNVNANSTNGGINITDPADGYMIYGKKTGANNAVYITKTSTSSTSSVIYGNNSGGGIGITGSAISNYGVAATSISSYGMYAYSTNSRGLYAGTGLGVTADFAGYFNGNTFSTGTYKGSDKKLKKNITEFSNALDIISRLKPKKYEYRNDGSYAYMQLPKGQRYGLIAQEVEEVLPNVVIQSHFRIADAMPPDNEEDGKKRSTEVIDFKAVDYTELIPLLIKAIQELQTEVDDLKKANINGNTGAVYNAITLEQNKPNPVNSSTTIMYNVPLPGARNISLIVSDISGKTIKQFKLAQLTGSVTIDASTFTNGTYTYMLLVDGKAVVTKKMIVSK